MSLELKRESFAAVREAMPLIEQHWREVAYYPDLMRPDIDTALYEALEEKGALYVLGARDGGEPVGYFVAFIARHPHHRRLKHAVDDVYFLRPSHRDPINGVRLLKRAEEDLREQGCQLMALRSSHRRDLGPLLRRLGYAPFETAYIKRLDQD
jgi:GNAT superfamily N-acetyltransferase